MASRSRALRLYTNRWPHILTDFEVLWDAYFIFTLAEKHGSSFSNTPYITSNGNNLKHKDAQGVTPLGC